MLCNDLACRILINIFQALVFIKRFNTEIDIFIAVDCELKTTMFDLEKVPVKSPLRKTATTCTLISIFCQPPEKINETS